MEIIDVYDIENCVDYQRIKLRIGITCYAEGEKILNKVLEHNKIDKGAYKQEDLNIVAFLRKDWSTNEVTCEKDLLSVYIKDIGELAFPDEWLSKRASKRCVEYVNELIQNHRVW